MAFNRPASAFRQALGSPQFPYEDGRYILYVAHACPWANGVLQAASIRNLVGNSDPTKDKMQVCVVHPTWQYTAPKKDRIKKEEDMKVGKEGQVAAAGVNPTSIHAGWVFAPPNTRLLPIAVMNNGKDFGLQLPGTAEEIIESDYSIVEADILQTYGCNSAHTTQDKSKFAAKTLRELYEKCGGFTESGVRPTTPLIFDTKTDSIVNNESTEILVALNEWPVEGDAASTAVDLYPAALKDEILKTIDWVYGINNGVYRCGFASAQKDYDAAAEALLARMEEVEKFLECKTFLLTSDAITAVDIRLFNTLVRMDEVYVCYFKCGFASLLSGRFPNMLRYTARVYHSCGGKIKQSVFMDDIQNHYFTSHAVRNMYGIVPKSVGFLQKLESMKAEL